MANKVVLPVKYPAVTSWQWHATLFSILGDDENAKRWIYRNISSCAAIILQSIQPEMRSYCAI